MNQQPNDPSQDPTRPLQPAQGYGQQPETGTGAEAPTSVMTDDSGAGYGGYPPSGQYPEDNGGGGRKGLWIIIAVVAAVLVAVGLVLAFGGDDDSADTDSSQTTSEATQSTETVTETVGEETGGGETEPPPVENPALFKLPDANINCTMEEMAVSCDIADFTYSAPPKPDDCPGDWGGRISLGSGPADFVCYSDALPSTDTKNVLEHGEATTVGDFTCTSDGDAVYCSNNTTGAMFSVSENAFQFNDGPS